ncbi:ElyC/SanA/YdcF family protein [Streptomyces sp. 8K308]|uniref:SanA/YdcF family protein n=1 Tax=Streptomyces sp. 8K308 TaxID=2530388 RepID=UPI001404F6EB|nr:ElyC/SanA/YdcF family protein [Streptomyces sp. 8K308]
MPRTVRGKRTAVQLVMAAVVLALLPATWVHASTHDRVTSVADAPSAPVAVVFGAGLRASGEPSAWLAHRLDAAAELFHSGRVRALLVTGDNSTEEYNEPDAMREYLMGLGVPAERIVADYAGFNTWNSCARAADVFGVTRALLVSQEFHIPRALALCRAAGIDAYGVGVSEHLSGLRVFSSLREIAGSIPAVWDAAFTPEPRFAGPRETSLQEILATVGGEDDMSGS